MTEAAAPGPPGGRVGGMALRAPLRLLSDERLSRRATSGDRRAFEEIFRRYHQELYRFCLATASNPQDAQDALQNTMVKVMRALPGEEREIQLRPWLYRIARNEAVETIRKRRGNVELGSERIASPWEIAEAASMRQRLRDLFSDLEELPERQRSALVMRELAGLEFEEIAEAFGTTSAVARQTLYEARQSLRQMEEGREMSCEGVRKAISDEDRRVTRRRDIRAHLRGCPSCRGFHEDIARRREGLAAIAPLPLALSAGLLQGVLANQVGAAAAAGAGGAAGGAGLAGTIGVGAGKAVASSVVVKSAATVAVVAAVGVGAAERGGVIDLPSPGGGKAATPEAAPPPSPGAEQAGPESAPGAVRRAAAQGEAAGKPVGADGKRSGAADQVRRAGRAARKKGRAARRGKPVPGNSRRRAKGKSQPPGRGGPPRGRPADPNRGQGAAKKSPQSSSAVVPSQPESPTAPKPKEAAQPKAESAPAEPETAPDGSAVPGVPPGKTKGAAGASAGATAPVDATEP